MKIKGEVIGGNKVGGKLGFPTANIAVSPKLEAEDGVYAALATIGGATHQGMVNLGYRPTIEEISGESELERLLEINIFDFDQRIYGDTIEVELVKYMRPEERFSSFEELKAAVDQDRIDIKNYFKSL